MKLWEKVALVLSVSSALILIHRAAEARLLDILWWIYR